MPGSLKRALVREVARRESNLNDVAVALLAERFGVPFSPAAAAARRSPARPAPSSSACRPSSAASSRPRRGAAS